MQLNMFDIQQPLYSGVYAREPSIPSDDRSALDADRHSRGGNGKSSQSGTQLRNAGIDKVLSNSPDWRELALIELREMSRWKKQETFTPNDIKRWVISTCGKPHHHNCWGGLTLRLITEKLIEETDLPQPRTGAHARKHTVYRWAS